MADISTPTTARKTEDFTATQIALVRNSLGINDYPFYPDRTYITFEAVSGNNNLHIATDASYTYSILKGDGSEILDYTDTGGVKVLNFASAGTYLITIIGDFQGIDTTGALLSDKDKYISIIGGTNYNTAIPATAFNTCVYLKEFYLISAVSIGGAAFNGCTSLLYARFPNVTTININTFLNCTSLTSAVFLGATVIGNTAFKSCVSLTSAIFPDVNTIGNESFQSCESLVNITFPIATTIGDNAFEFCASLVNAIFPDATSIGASCFRLCKSLSSIDFESLISVELQAFDSCNSLITVNFQSATTISSGGFSGCNSLIDAYLPSITTIGSNAFLNATSLKVFSLKYSLGLSITAVAFSTVVLSDLYVIGAANLTEAQEIETKLTIAGMTQLNGYRLLY
ncbi:MAG: leucine-rich repeat protein [Bacteroidales bacterium]|jgi:hypothetical protein|nr:leucine-rich repeat protein [Bacteroidales bacterium]